jgi:cobalt/nickel transport system permease protein/cobalt/nickel transport protein
VKKAVAAILVLVVVVVVLMLIPGAEWSGIDETVVKKFAEQAGRPGREPFINTDQGDLLLFAFLMAGLIGGIVIGYNFHQLFHASQTDEAKRSSDV